MVPQTRYRNSVAPALDKSSIKSQYNSLSCLLDIERASKMLLGALYRQKEMNPIDYLHKGLNMEFEHLSASSDEYLAILQYIKNTCEGSINFETHKVKLFKVERKGEAENVHDFDQILRDQAKGSKNKNPQTDLNKRLLFHGSMVYNFLGILSQGLRIAPPEAPSTGARFGKGLYFTDMFSKANSYAQSWGESSTMVLLCDVTLGKMCEKVGAEDMENLPAPYKSVHGLGRTGPDPSQSLVHPEGVEIPSGPVIDLKVKMPDSKRKPTGGKGLGKSLAAPANPFGGFGGFQQALAGNFGAFSAAPSDVHIPPHNEFVVYNTNQVRMRYLVQVCKKTKEELAAANK